MQHDSCSDLTLPMIGNALLPSTTAIKKTNDHDHNNEMPRPMPIRLCALDENRGRSPSFQLILDNEQSCADITPTARRGINRPVSIYIPQLQRKTTESGAQTPSPLARRGLEERKYLESQLRAEVIRRRNQQFLNNERKLRLNSNTYKDKSSQTDQSDDKNKPFLQKISLRSQDLTGEQGPSKVTSEKFSGETIHGQSSSIDNDTSPVVIHNTHRTDSAVLPDYWDEDNKDACLLYFPDGLPLVEENLEEGGYHSHQILSNCPSFEERCTVSSENTNEEMTAGCTSNGTTSCRSTPTMEEISFTQQDHESKGALDSHLQCDYYLSTKGNKKVLLRPKLTARPKTLPESPIKNPQVADGEHFVINGEERVLFVQERNNEPSILDTKEFTARVDSFAKTLSKSDLLQFSFEQRNDRDVRPHSNLQCRADKEGGGQAFDFSSPEASKRLPNCHMKEIYPPLKLKDEESLILCSKSDYENDMFKNFNLLSTSDSFHQLPLEHKVDFCVKSSSFHSNKVESNCESQIFNYSSPEASKHLPLDETSKATSILTRRVFIDNTTEMNNEIATVKEPLSESDYCTPDHSNGATKRKRFGVKLSNTLLTLPELFLPKFEAKSESG